MSLSGRGRRWLVDAHATGDLQRIRPSMAAAGERVNDARRDRLVLSYASNALVGVVADEDLRAADQIRRDRAIAEYGEFAARQFNADHVRWAAGVAERIVRAVAADLAERRPG